MPTNTKPTSSTRSATARANGAKSHGPATPEGRARSSQNALRHGLAVRAAALPTVSVVLDDESPDDFQRLLDSYLDEFAPASSVEVELVETMAAARWRLRRLAEIEATLLGNEIERSARYIENDFESLDRDPDDADRLAYAFKDLSDRRTLGLMIRYEGALSRSYSRAFKQLQILRSYRERPQPNEPKPAASPALTTAPHRPASPQSLLVEPASDRAAPEIRTESQQNPALPSQRATIEVPPRINVQHLHP
jgi:hypothetical protein